MRLGGESSPRPDDAPRPGHARPEPPTRFDLDNVDDAAIVNDVRLAFNDAKAHFADETNAAPVQGEPLATSLARTVARLAFPLDVSHADRDELVAFLLTYLGAALPHGAELILGQRTLRQAVWPITFLFLGALGLNTVMQSEGTPIDLPTVMGQIAMGVLPSFSRSKQAQVYAAANATFWRILDNYTEEEGAWIEVIANGVVRYALEGSHEGEDALGGICEFLESKFRMEDPLSHTAKVPTIACIKVSLRDVRPAIWLRQVQEHSGPRLGDAEKSRGNMRSYYGIRWMRAEPRATGRRG